MKKRMFKMSLRGGFNGILICYVITLLISPMIGDGSRYYACHPALVELVGGDEMRAVLLQTGLAALLGAGATLTSLIWEAERWSIFRQSVLYFLINALLMMPIAYVCNWMPHTVAGVLGYVGIYTAVIGLTWLFRWLVWRARVRKINAAMERQ